MLSSSRKSIYSLITIIGLGYFVAFATIQFIADRLGGTIPFFDFYHVPFIVLFLVSIFLVWTRPKTGYLVSIVAGLVAIAIFTPFTFVKGLSSPADVALFVYVMTIFPLMLAAVSFQQWVSWKCGSRQDPALSGFRYSNAQLLCWSSDS